MNAIDFVKDHGIEEAKRIVSESPEGGASYNYIFEKYSDGMTKKGLYWVQVNHLKQLVESWELIAKFDGLEECKRIVSSAPSGAIGYHTMYEGYFDEKSKLYYEGLNQCLIVDLEQAIADVESVGEKDK